MKWTTLHSKFKYHLVTHLKHFTQPLDETNVISKQLGNLIQLIFFLPDDYVDIIILKYRIGMEICNSQPEISKVPVFLAHGP